MTVKYRACLVLGLVVLMLIQWPLQAYEAVQVGPVTLKPTIKTILGLRYGEGINYGLGALDALGETERARLALPFTRKYPHHPKSSL